MKIGRGEYRVQVRCEVYGGHALYHSNKIRVKLDFFSILVFYFCLYYIIVIFLYYIFLCAVSSLKALIRDINCLNIVTF